ncbi:hypothetical protein [Chondromyces crocatus]|uniref:Uncharacterized protein n=1 Tax=Chondromyces crocatus TaxID=52 RepID=A0A0K1EJZ8_CHOCO|nr:hypothetical protein [Chondromyces crocatus]AKT41185.1 uncharacterized protein CMC5_053460 [Chondromyces crocatus]
MSEHVLSDPVRLLAANGALQVLVSSLLGVYMLIPMQPWGKRLAPRVNMKSLLAAHLDWLMLAFMQWGAAFAMNTWSSTRSLAVALLLVFGGWTNPTPYLLRGAGINAFVLAGRPAQIVAASVAGLSSLAIIIAWAILSWGLVFGP